MASIIVVEDEALLARQVARALTAADHLVRIADNIGVATELLDQAPPDLLLLDLRLPDGSGLDLLPKVREIDESIQVILMTAYGSVSDAVEAMRKGAADYIQKPLDMDELQLIIEQTLTRRSRERELAYHRGRGHASRKNVIGEDSRLEDIFRQIERLSVAGLSPSRRPTILISGETGTGKGMLARAIHEMLGGGPFIAANCTAMPESLIEAELFGHEKGSFTDAKVARSGLFDAAEGGTIFLDEIGHASAALQSKLLKVLEEKRVRRLGSTEDRDVDVHVIAATNRDLDEAVESGAFRRDLLHRLRVLTFEAPPLRDRPADLVLLAKHFCAEVAVIYQRNVVLSDEAIGKLGSYEWPGNVRELRNVIERSVLVNSESRISGETIARLLNLKPAARGGVGRFILPETGVDLATVERDLIIQALEVAEGNQTQASRLLGLTRDTLRYRLDKFEIRH
jgi:two-component system response regulator AtoC